MTVMLQATPTTFLAAGGNVDSTKRYMWKKEAGPQVLTTGRTMVFGTPGVGVLTIRYAVDGAVRQAVGATALPDPSWTATIVKFDTLP